MWTNNINIKYAIKNNIIPYQLNVKIISNKFNTIFNIFFKIIPFSHKDTSLSLSSTVSLKRDLWLALVIHRLVWHYTGSYEWPAHTILKYVVMEIGLKSIKYFSILFFTTAPCLATANNFFVLILLPHCKSLGFNVLYTHWPSELKTLK